MQNSGSMNQVYRLVWNAATGVWQAVCECGKGRGKPKSGKSRTINLPSLAAGALVWMPLSALAANLPTGGQIVAGSGAISQSGNTLTITQTSAKLAADWQSFSIGQGHTVNFVQPSASAVALNRVLGADVSVIQGALNANGQVFLVNPNGVLFTPSAQVNTGALVASTLQLSTGDFMAGNYRFGGNSTAGVTNEGSITTASGGAVALIAARIENTGNITAPQGHVLMGAGSTVRLDLGGPVKLEVEAGALNTLITQGGAIRADGGVVYLTAKAAGDLASSVINHTGITEARTLSTGARGEILLMGDMAKGVVNVGGTLDASAPHGGSGGSVETSAANVHIANGVTVNTSAAHGLTGSWLIDPTDFTIASGAGAQTGSGIGATTLQNALASTNVTIATSATNTGGELGDIHVNSAVAWNTNTLTLSAHNNININATLNGGAAGKLSLLYGQASANGGSSTYNVNAAVNLAAGPNFSTQLGSSGPLKSYTVITALGAPGSTSGTDLQGINGGLAANYVLGSNIDASATAGWNGGAGFSPLMVTTPDTSFMCINMGMCNPQVTPFSGTFDGLGHSISALTINRPSTDFVGLFAQTGAAAVVRNVGIVGGSVGGQSWVGALVGDDSGTISNSYATSTVTGAVSYIGGLVGAKHSSAISNSYSTGTVTGDSYVGGLLGFSDFSTVSTSYTTGTVSGNGQIGGLVGENYNGSISNSYATGTTYGSTYAGGLVGLNSSGATIQNSYTTGSLSGGNRLGGLVGVNQGTLTDTYSAVSITDIAAQDLFGGLVGDNSGTVTRSYAVGVVNVQVPTNNAGALLGSNSGTISNSYWNSDTNTGYGLSGIGLGSSTGATGLSSAQMQQASSFTGFNFTSTPGATGNNWVIVNGDGSLNSVGAQGGGTTPMLAAEFSTTIKNAHQLQLMAMNMGGNYAMGAHIGAAGTTGTGDVWSSAGFVPVGSYWTNNYFTGSFDGLSHTITGLTTNINGNGIGLFGVISGATVKNIGLVGGSVTGGNGVGALVGMSNAGSSISNSFSTGTVTGGSDVGGLVGLNGNGGPSSISSSYATGAVNGGGMGSVGGLVGTHNSGTIDNSYATGAVTVGNGMMPGAGGLVGRNAAAISNSYATGLVTAAGGMAFVGGLVGENNGTISTAYWDTSTNATGIGLGTLTGATGLTTAQMKTSSNLGGFDFTTTPTWGFGGGSNSGYPVLCAFGGCIAQTISVYINPLAGSSVYGSAPVFSYALVDGGGALYSLTNATLSGTALYTSAPTRFSNAGDYTFSYDSGLSLSGAGASNYVLLAWNTPTAWTVNKANAVVTANNASKTYDDTAYSGGNGVSYSGLVNSETAAVLGGSLVYTGTSQGATNAGIYAITPGGLTSSNYALSFASGALTITAAPPNGGTTGQDPSIQQAAITVALQAASQAGGAVSSGGGTAGGGVLPPTGGVTEFRVEGSARGVANGGPSTSGGLALVDVANAPLPGQPSGASNANGFMTVFVVNGGIQLGDGDRKPTAH